MPDGRVPVRVSRADHKNSRGLSNTDKIAHALVTVLKRCIQHPARSSKSRSPDLSNATHQQASATALNYFDCVCGRAASLPNYKKTFSSLLGKCLELLNHDVRDVCQCHAPGLQPVHLKSCITGLDDAGGRLGPKHHFAILTRTLNPGVEHLAQSIQWVSPAPPFSTDSSH